VDVDIGDGTDRLLVVGVAVEMSDAGSSITGLAYGGTPMHLSAAAINDPIQAYVYYLTESELPATAGTYAVTATTDDSDPAFHIHATELNGVADRAAWDTNAGSVTGAMPTTNLTLVSAAVDGSWIVDLVAADLTAGDLSITQGPAQVEQGNTEGDGLESGSSTRQAPTAEVSVGVGWQSSNAASTRLAHAAAMFRPAGGPGGCLAVGGDGCNDSCQVDPGWVCPVAGSPCIPRCGDGLLVGYEECEDGGVCAGGSNDGNPCANSDDCPAGVCRPSSGDGCNAACLVEPGYFDCPPGGPACTLAECGNGVVEAEEGCDDGNDIFGDGCTPACLLEPTFNPDGSVNAVCGDGVKLPTEECDDGNTTSGDGCSNICLSEAVCGNGLREGAEQCDDGNRISGDGCSAACRNEVCGDGVTQAGQGEQCDDGNNVSGDGCNAQCLREYCGDGVRQASLGEECDDGNYYSGDGCSPYCVVEIVW
jgi:cysteine-rich repeat protein